MKIFYFLIFSILLVSCTIPSEAMIQTAIANTQKALPKYTLALTQDAYCYIDSVNQYTIAAGASFQEFIDKVLLIESTIGNLSERNSTVNLVSQLQGIRTKNTYTEFTPCVKSARNIMIDYMNQTINYYLDVLSGISTPIPTGATERSGKLPWEFNIRDMRTISQDAKMEFDSRISAIRNCAPYSNSLYCG